MGRNSSGVAGKGASNNGTAGKGKTEEGYTPKMVKNIVGLEQKYRNNKDETLHFFSPSGDIIKSVGGKGAQVAFDAKSIPANTIMTHNHPRSIGEKGIKRIGNSFSVEDIASAVGVNAKEIRAVTPTYTFSLKRPKGGWGGSVKDIVSDYQAANKKVFTSNKGYIWEQSQKGNYDSALERAEVSHFHKVMKIMSAKYGWKYSKKKG